MSDSSLLSIALRRPVVITALKLSLLVGSVLAAINHGPALLEGGMSSGRWLQVGLTYLVPYGVSTYSSARALQGTEQPSPVPGSRP
ncbi:hypothetical protein EYC98_09475 [Halieaceae bacterium IMCC14734]|uniref:Phosphoenolpyruvate protein kinase n=1 Tax=Candidatus Litorirhabdus singularis TaxID=2518993 RepID=A0ABT3TI94_9GAMM|nr:nitrate/nitrite transporter NrtS [Candidatus Litorirhabdus singularis]MCX2981092.1 hypothetical protein [Candidatus Litorirhabdus singularis]